MQYAKLALALPLLLGLCAAPARANLVINATFDSSWSTDANATVDEAAITNLINNVYQKNFTNPITVAIDFTNDVNVGLGTSLTGFYSSSYTSYRNALTADKQIANGGDGNTGFLAGLPAGGNPVPGNGTAGVTFTSAQGRALGKNDPGVVTVGTGTFDSQISLNVGAFPTTDGGAALAATTAHEINEALGLYSALDGSADAPGTPTVANVGSLDFFRYAAIGNNTTANPTPTANRSFTSSSAAVSYFSDTGGTNPIVYFNQVTNNDYHDWASNGEAFQGPIRVQDAAGPASAAPQMSAAEFKALNDIGYNLVAAPEPSQFADVGFVAFGVFGLLLRARRSKATEKG